jgi:hypothetical protein
MSSIAVSGFKKDNRMAADAFFSSGISHFFSGGRFDVHRPRIGTAGFCQYFLHGRDVVRQARGLADDGDIGISETKSFLVNEFHHLLEKGDRIYPGEMGIGIGKMVTDIASPDGPEECIAEGVGNDIGIRMSG